MNKASAVVSLLCAATILNVAQTTSSSAEVVVNNILSPFTTIQVGPGQRHYGSRSWWVHDPYHHQRCYRRWDPYYGEWQWHCVRMNYGYGPFYGYGYY